MLLIARAIQRTQAALLIDTSKEALTSGRGLTAIDLNGLFPDAAGIMNLSLLEMNGAAAVDVRNSRAARASITSCQGCVIGGNKLATVCVVCCHADHPCPQPWPPLRFHSGSAAAPRILPAPSICFPSVW
jgi:hypothetical protein